MQTMAAVPHLSINALVNINPYSTNLRNIMVIWKQIDPWFDLQISYYYFQ